MTDLALRRTWQRLYPTPHGSFGWRDRAACANSDLTLDDFFPRSRHPDAGQAAKAVCATCPVATECLDEQLRIASGGQDMDHGVWGGTTPAERATIRKQTATCVHPTERTADMTDHPQQGAEMLAASLPLRPYTALSSGEQAVAAIAVSLREGELWDVANRCDARTRALVVDAVTVGLGL